MEMLAQAAGEGGPPSQLASCGFYPEHLAFMASISMDPHITIKRA